MSEVALMPLPPTFGKGVVQLEHVPTQLLYVEDDEDLRDMIASTFIDAGFEVTAVSSAEDALHELGGAHFDVILTDYNLTGETGAWLLRNAAAKGFLERTAAIVMTADHQPAGVAGYRLLRKPTDFAVLLAAIDDAVGAIVPAGVMRLGAAHATELELVLYVTSTSQESQKAIRNMHRALKPYDKGRYCLTIVEVGNGGNEDWYQGLEEDRVIVTPTLVKKRPGPKTWIVGSLSPIDAVERMLESVLGSREES